MKKIFFLQLIITLAISSCSDGFLERYPIDSLDPDNFFKTENDCRLVINGLYNQLGYADFMGLDLYSDDIYSGAPKTSGISYLQGNLQPMDSYTKTRWVKDYKQIGLANLADQGITTAPLNDAIKNQLISEAKFFRAFYYFDLVSLWGDVPLILTKPSISENLTPARTPKAQVLTQILADLDFSIQNLPVSYAATDKGRVTRGAALATKARVLLFFGKYSEAAVEAKKCMDLNVYGLFSDLRGLFTEANEYSKEVVFDISYMRDLKPSERNMNLIRQNMWEPTLSLANEFEMANGKMIGDVGSGFDPQNPGAGRDPRLLSYICFPGSVKDGIVNQDGSFQYFIPKTELPETGMQIKKSADYADLQNNNSGINYIIIRYAEVLLTFAEASNEANGPSSDVYAAVNQVRQRAKMPDLPTGLTKEEMRARIRHERRVELCGEGLRFFDVVRWNIGSQVLTKNLEGYDRNSLSNPKDPAKWIFKPANVLVTNWNASKGYLWPIPQTEIQLNSSLTQNAGYN